MSARAFGYVKIDAPRAVFVDGDWRDRGVLTDGRGEVLGTVVEVSRWRTPRSWVSPTMHSYRVMIDGEHYFGRGHGNGMSLQLKRRTRREDRNAA